MKNIDVVGDELRAAISRFLIPLQTSRTVDRESLGEIERTARLLAERLKGSDLVSKSLLNELHVTAKVVRAEAKYIKGEATRLAEFADRIETIFDLILCDETLDSQRQGIPRII